MIEILTEIAKQGPIVALLISAIIYFLQKLKKKDLDLTELNLELRNIEKENLVALYKVMAFAEKIDGKEKGRNEMLLKELEEMRKSIESKLNDLKK